MRIVIGVIGVLAACVFIGQSAVTLGQTAYNMASNDEVWRQALMAAGASSVVIYEGIGLVFAGLLWHVGKRGLAFGCCLLVLAAAVYTVRLELAYNVTGQADRIAEREASTERRTEAKSDLTYYRAQRAEMGTVPAVGAIQADINSYKQHRRWDSTSGCTNATVPKSISFCERYHALEAQLASAKKLEKINTKIEALEDQRNWVPVNAGGAPDAAWAARNFGGGEQGWADAFMVFGILFWVLARTLALPIAVGAMTAARPSSRRHDETDSAVTPLHSSPAPTLAGNDGEMTDKSAEILGFPRIENDQDDGSDDDSDDYPKGKVSEWLNARTCENGDAVVKGTIMHDDYRHWCRHNGRHPVVATLFGRKLRELDVARVKRADGIYYCGYALRCEGGSEGDKAEAA